MIANLAVLVVTLVAGAVEPKNLYDEVLAARRCESGLCSFDLGDLGFTITFPGEHAEVGVFKKVETAAFRRFAYSLFNQCIIITGAKNGPPISVGRQLRGEVPEVFVSALNGEVYRTISECEKAKGK